MKKIVLDFLANSIPGYHFWVYRKRTEPNGEYIMPRFVYAPWKKISPFIKQINPYTVVSKTRLFELYELVGQVAKTEGDIIEVGTFRGGSSAVIARSLIDHGSKSKLYLCDTFNGVVKSTDVDTHFFDGEFKASESDVREALKLAGEGVEFTIVSGVFPEESSHLIPESATFCLCHIDVDVYESAKDIFNWVWPRIVQGGIVVFDDYGSILCPGIQKLVTEISTMNDCIFIYNLNGHAIVIKR